MPAALFWWAAPAAFRIESPSVAREIDFTLVGNAFAFGWGFVALINAPISILSAGMLETGTIYSKAVESFIGAIAAEEEPRMRSFRRALDNELATTPHFSSKGFNDLAECVGIRYTYLSQNEAELNAKQVVLVRKIKTMMTKATQAEKADEIVKLLRTEEVLSRRDWPELIRAFGGREAFIQRYFEARPAKRASRRP